MQIALIDSVIPPSRYSNAYSSLVKPYLVHQLIHTQTLISQAFAYCLVHSLAVCIAAGSSSFQRCATSFASGSSGLGAPSSACIESRMVRICKAGDQLPGSLISFDASRRIYVILLSTSKQMRPSLSMLGWYIFVRKRIFGGVMG